MRLFTSVMVPLRLLNLKCRSYRQTESRSMHTFHPCCRCPVGGTSYVRWADQAKLVIGLLWSRWTAAISCLKMEPHRIWS
jgi:hypothetical protein